LPWTTLGWTEENQLWHVAKTGASESCLAHANGECVKRTTNGIITFYMGGMVEESGDVKRHAYTFNGQVIAERDVPADPLKPSTFKYLHTDHLGSIAATSTSNASPTIQRQYYTPWGEARASGATLTSLSPADRNFTGQRKDSTGRLFYNAHYYDPMLSHFISADSIVPGMASGKGGERRRRCR
jgi:RHS repeat-associated protein